MAEHRHQWADPRAARNQEQRASDGDVPDEVPADRAAELELVADAHLAREKWRDLTVVDALDGHGHAVADVRRRCDRIASLRLVSVVRSETDVDVLPCKMTGPIRHVHDHAADSRGLVDEIGDFTDAPAQSPL